MIPEPRSTKPKSYKEALTLPKTPERTKSPYDGTLNSTPMRVARGGSSAVAVAVGAPVAKVTSPLAGPVTKGGRASAKLISPAPTIVPVSSDSSQSDGWQVAKRQRRSTRRTGDDGLDGTREPSPPPRSPKRKQAKARPFSFPSPLEEGNEDAEPVRSQDVEPAEPRESDAALALLNSDASPAPAPARSKRTRPTDPARGQPMLPPMPFRALELPAAGRAPAQDLTGLQLQRLAVRGAAPDGIDLAQALLECLTNRALLSNWCFPAGLPETRLGMLRMLLRAAKELDPDSKFCLKHPFTPDQLLASTRFGSALSYLNAVRNALKSKKRICSLEGDLLLAAVASLHFGVRIMILGGASLEIPHPQLVYDFHPADDVVAERSIALIMCPSTGGFNWLHPDTTILPEASEEFTPQCAFLVAALAEPLLDWTDDADTDRAVVGYTELTAAAASAAVNKVQPNVKTAQLACQLPLQRLAVRGNASPGLELCEALHQALHMRALISGWEYPDGLPANGTELRDALLRAASTLQPDEELNLLSPVTPNDLFVNSRLNDLSEFLAEARFNVKRIMDATKRKQALLQQSRPRRQRPKISERQQRKLEAGFPMKKYSSVPTTSRTQALQRLGAA